MLAARSATPAAAEVDELAVRKGTGHLRGQLGRELEPPQVEVDAPRLQQGLRLDPDGLRFSLGDGADACRLGAPLSLLVDDVLLGIGAGLGDLGRAQLRL